MPLTSYCKKCGKDVPLGDSCPHCHSRLAANTARLAWCIEHRPAADWLCWNAVMRLLLPALGLALLLVLVLEAFMGGAEGVMTMLTGGLLVGMAALLVFLTALILLALILQGSDVQECVLDAKGIHVTTYLPVPSKLKLLLRGCPPSMEGTDVCVARKEIAWKDVRRVQLWPEKMMILFYAPTWWMRVGLPCTPFDWEETLETIREKIGKKKNVVLPECCRQTSAAKAKPLRGKKEQQLSISDVPSMADDMEHAEDFTSLDDVLNELKQNQPE